MKELTWRAYTVQKELTEAISAAISETGEIVSEAAYDKVKALAQQKAITLADIALFIKDCETVRLPHLDLMIEEIKKKKQQVQRAVDALTRVIEQLLPEDEKVETDFVCVGWRKNPPSVEYDGPAELLPAEYQRLIPAHVEPDKKAMASALKAGKEIPGARLMQRKVIYVK